MSDALRQAREYEAEAAAMPSQEKACYHLSSPVGWINDPNGFSLFQDKYHLFYQYHPYSTAWGPMHWGHSTTEDFIRWEQQPAALAPDHVYDGQGCFSGSALEHEGKHILMYTGVREYVDDEGNKHISQQQCIASGDGKDYKKIADNPVITADLLPPGCSRVDFRDPKIWKKDGRFYAVAGSRGADGSGQIPLFVSDNLREWKFVKIIEGSGNEYGKMWECPDFFPLDHSQVLLVSPQDMQAQGLEFHNGNATAYLLGSYDEKEHVFVREQIRAVDYGLDFYAPQTLESVDGRRIMIGWMQSWDNHICPPGRPWSGMMTIPRELRIIEGKLYQNPVRELENYYGDKVTGEASLNGRDKKTCSVPGLKGRTLDFTVEVTEGEFGRFEIQVAKKEGRYTSIRYDTADSIVTFDRTYCGLCRDFIASRSMKVESRGGKIKLRILLDLYSVEIFVNDGAQAMTSLIETPISAGDISFLSDGLCFFRVSGHQIVMQPAVTALF